MAADAPRDADQPLVVPPDGGATFFGAPLATDLAALAAEVAVLGIPYGVPYGMRGVAGESSDAPRAIRAMSARRGQASLTHWDFDFDDGPLLGRTQARIVDCGDVPADPLDIPANSRRATDAVRAVLERGAFPVVLGGDDSIPIPFLRAFEGRGPFTLVHIDAHIDFRDELDGVREGYSSPIRRASEMPWIEQIVQIGMRGVGSARPEEVAAARAHGNRLVRAAELRERGVPWLLEQLPAGGRFLVSLDFDGLDPAVAPGVGAPSPGGLAFDDAAGILRGLAQRGRVAGIDLVEYAPALDVNGLTALVGVRLIANLLGAMARAGAFG